jgi:hypothetical protein
MIAPLETSTKLVGEEALYHTSGLYLKSIPAYAFSTKLNTLAQFVGVLTVVMMLIPTANSSMESMQSTVLQRRIKY